MRFIVDDGQVVAGDPIDVATINFLARTTSTRLSGCR
jgi:hypothetical protein